MKLADQVAVITGAGRNVGEAVAGRFAAEGARIAVVDMNTERAQRVADALNGAAPGSALAITADVTSSNDVQAMVSKAVDHFGRIDILVNNVGIVDRSPILDLEESEWDRVISTSLKSVFLCTKYTARHMVEAGRGGRIVNVASTSGIIPPRDRVAYPAAKAGVLHMTKAIALQLAPHNIRVNSVTPNLVASVVDPDEHPRNYPIRNLLSRQCQPDDVAKAALFLVSDDADFLTGTDILVDGGAFITR